MTTSFASGPGSDLSTRFAAAIVMIAVASVAIYIGGWPFRILVALAAAAMLFEWCDMHRIPRFWVYAGMLFMAAATLALPEWLFPVAERDPAEIASILLSPSWRGFAIVAAASLLLAVISRRVAFGWGFFYIAFPSFALIVLSWVWFELVFWLMLVTWATDIFAYFAGRSIGGAKLAPRISPNKTWAGLFGGMAGAAVVGALAARGLGLEAPFFFAGAFMGLIAQLGDLYESKVKRKAGVKDSGRLLPGHGGVLDRLDGLLPVIIATLALLMVMLATA